MLVIYYLVNYNLLSILLLNYFFRVVRGYSIRIVTLLSSKRKPSIFFVNISELSHAYL